MAIATVKNFIRGGNFTTLYYVVKTILQHDNYCQRKFIDGQFDDWHYFRNVQLKFGDGLVNTKEGNKSYFSITPELYEVYVDAMWSIDRQPIRWTDIPKKNDEVENTKDTIDNEVNITKDKIDSEINKTRDAINREVELTRQKEKDNNVHYVDYDMEVESMDFRTAANLLNENGYYLVDEN